MAEQVCKGSCLCGEVEYEISGNMGIFQYCHCSRCRKFTGSAHASNLFVKPTDFKWNKGEDMVMSYQPDFSKYFATAFCQQCGSSMPWLSKSGQVMVITAGTLDDAPSIRPNQNIFCASSATWYEPVDNLPKFDELPPRKG